MGAHSLLSGSVSPALRCLGLTGVTLFVLVGLAVNATASAPGYDLSYSQSPTTSNPDVSLTHLTTSYSGGPNLTCTFGVAGTIVLSSSDYGYIVLFGGNTTTNANAYASFGGNNSSGTITSLGIAWYGTYAGQAPLSFDLANASSTLSFSVATKLVGPASNFTVLAEALYVNATGEQFSTLGSASLSTSTSGGSDVWLGIVVTAVLIAAVAAVVVVILWRRRRRPTPASDFV